MSRKKSNQLVLAVRRYRVIIDGFTYYETDAKSPGQAKWRAFKAAREADYFPRGFRQFLNSGARASEIRR